MSHPVWNIEDSGHFRVFFHVNHTRWVRCLCILFSHLYKLSWFKKNLCFWMFSNWVSSNSHFFRHLNSRFFREKWEKINTFQISLKKYPKQIQNPNPAALLRASTLHVLYIWVPNMSRQFSAVWLEGRRFSARQKFLIERVKRRCHFSKLCPEFMHSKLGVNSKDKVIWIGTIRYRTLFQYKPDPRPSF